MFGNLANFWILALFGGPKLKIWQKSVKNYFFSTLGPQKGPKITKLAHFPNNVWKTHEMQQLGQKWGSRSDLEPKYKGLTILAKCDF